MPLGADRPVGRVMGSLGRAIPSRSSEPTRTQPARRLGFRHNAGADGSRTGAGSSLDWAIRLSDTHTRYTSRRIEQFDAAQFGRRPHLRRHRWAL